MKNFLRVQLGVGWMTMAALLFGCAETSEGDCVTGLAGCACFEDATCSGDLACYEGACLTQTDTLADDPDTSSNVISDDDSAGDSDGYFDEDPDSDGGGNSDEDTECEGEKDAEDRTETDTVAPGVCPWQEPPELPDTPDWVDGTLIEFNDNGGWCWYQDERAVVDLGGGKIIVGSVASGGSRDGYIEAVIYDLQTGATKRDVLHTNLSVDDHNAPAFLVLPTGNYLAMYAGHNHNHNSYWRIYNGSSWSSERIYTWDTNDYTATYSNLWYMSAEERLYNFCRSSDKSPNMMISENQGQTWSYGGRLTRSSGIGYVNGYFKYWGNGVDRIDFLGTEAHPRDHDTSLYHGYVKGGKSYNSRGTVMDNDIFDTNVPAVTDFTKVFASGTTVAATRMTKAWNIDIQRYDDGTIATVFEARANDSDTDHRFLYARFNGSTWVTTYLGEAGDKLYDSEEDYTGLAAMDPNDSRVIYISTPFDPRDDTNLGVHEIFKGVTCDEGATFHWAPVTGNSSADNLRPIVPSWNAHNKALLWWKGTYSTAQIYDASVVGIISTAE